MKFIDLITKNRSYRRFYQDIDITDEDLLKMVEAARLSPSSRNIQPLKYLISNNRELNALIYSTLAWAGYLADWDGPQEGERPAGYIVQLLDKNISNSYSCDNGITSQSILLQAVELGYGGCIIASVKRETLSRILELPDNLEIINVIALGKPKEHIVIDPIVDNEYKYWRDAKQTHHVPKRSLEDIVIKK